MKYQLIKGEDFNYYVYKNRVEKIVFTDEKVPKRIQLKIVQKRVQLKIVKLTDLSNDRDGSVVGWMEDDGVYKVSTQLEGQRVIFNEDCRKMFYGGRFCCVDIESSKRNESEMKEVYFNNVDTSHVTNMRSMFEHCKQLLKLDLSNFNTSKVEHMHEMFAGCEELEKLDLSHFDTSKVTDMELMFADCENLQELDLNHFDTSKVEEMSDMFSGCKNLEKLNLSNWKLDSIVYLDSVFAGCDKLTSLEATDIQLKNEYQKTVVQQQNKIYSNIDLNNLKISEGKEMQKEKDIDKEN